MEFLNTKKIPYFIIAALMALIMATATFMDVFGRSDNENVISMYDAWHLEGSSEPVQKISMQKGETYILTAEVPDVFVISPCLTLISDFCATTVYCGDEEVYRYGWDYLEAGSIVPKDILFVPISPNMEGETLRVELVASVDTTYSLHTYYYGGVEEVVTFFLQSRRLPIIVGLFLVFFGALLFITLPVIVGHIQREPSVFFHGFLLTDLGLYFLLYNTLPQFYRSQGLLAECKMEYLCLYLIPLFIHGTMVFGERRKRQIMDYTLLVLDVMFPLTALILDLTGICSITEVLPLAHAIFFVQGAYCVYYLFVAVRRMHRDNTMYFDDSASSALVILVGLNLFVVCTYIDLIGWYVMSAEAKAAMVVRGAFLMIGAFLIAVSLTLSYFFHRLAEVNEAEARESLEDLAFTDALTGLYNRTYCEQIMAKMTHLNEPGCIISLDLDRLKEVNDTKGHQVGDLFLQSFADVLRDAFRGTGVVGRMGGDEFLVIMDADHAPHVRSYIVAFERAMSFKNEATALFSLSASWGIANTQDDGNGDYHATYMIADERMYNMKQKHHERQERGVGL